LLCKSLKDSYLYIGNTSNPVINRTGIVQPWATNYANSKSLSSKVKWVSLVAKLLSNYMSYGVNYNSNIFIHEYWYKKHKNFRSLPSRIYMQYFKRFFYTNNILSIEHSFLIRKKTKEFFYFRPWVLIHNNWFIFIVCWYKPPKPYVTSQQTTKKSALNIRKTTKKNKFINLYPDLTFNRYKF
jgi:hypothetical protein